MNIAYITSDQGGCRHYRCVMPAALLQANGHKVLVGGHLAAQPSGEICVRISPTEAARGFDVIVLQRWMHAEAPRIIRAARAYGQAVINDVDDWFFGIPTSNQGFHATAKSADAEHNREHYRQALAASSAITVSTPYLAERLRQLGAPVYVLPNRIDLHRWTPATPAQVASNVGWLGSLPFRADGDLGQLRGVLGPFLDRHPHLRFMHAGARSADAAVDRETMVAAVGIDERRLIQRDAVGIERLPELYAGIDIGLAPLEDCPFNRSKSWLKGLEMAAAGIPFVASDMPEYRELGAGILARRPKEWSAALERLLDHDERVKLATEGRAIAASHDIAHHWQSWEQAYMQVTTGALAAALA